MSTDNANDFNEPLQGEENLPEPARKRLRDLEKKIKDLEPIQSENARLKLEKSLHKNGMDLDDMQLTALLAAHGQGEQTPEALRKTAEALKFVEPIPATNASDEDAQKGFDAAQQGAETQTGKQLSYEDEVEAATSMAQLQEIAQKWGK